MVLVVLPAGFDTQRLIHDGFVGDDTLGDEMLHRNIRKAIQNIPCAGGVHIIAENDLRNLFQQRLLVQVGQCSAELVGIGVFAVYNNHCPAVIVQKAVDTIFNGNAGIGDLAEIGEGVLVGSIQKGNKFLVVVQNVAILAVGPVDVDLVGITVFVGVVFHGGGFDAVFSLTVGHDEQFPDVLPFHPDREDSFAVVNTVGNQLVDVDDVLIQLAICFYNGNPIRFQLPETVLGNHIREGMEILQVIGHLVVQGAVVLLNGCAEHTGVADNPGILAALQLHEYIHFGGFIVRLKMTFLHADQIGNLGNNGIGAALVIDCGIHCRFSFEVVLYWLRLHNTASKVPFCKNGFSE